MDSLSVGGWVLRRYTEADAPLWDDFAARARNSTFLFSRRYMGYHADRFRDCSLIALLRGKVRALLPADAAPDGSLRSHGGLTYGGWILPDRHLDGADLIPLFETLMRWCRAEGFSRIDYRPLPHIYARRPSQEDVYALFRMGARMSACGLSSTIDYADPGQLNSLQKRHLRDAAAFCPVITEQTDPSAFHAMLTACLRERHDATPVHTLPELKMLMERFPRNIRVFTISTDGVTPLAGICMYLSGCVAHAQYIATSPEGRRTNMLPPLTVELIRRFAPSHRYFDFGISTEQGGRILNPGLLRQKTSFGASATIYPQFILDL